MTDRPILFSAPMVRAILSGAKTQTRRICKPAPTPDDRFAGGHYFPGKRKGAADISVEAPYVGLACPHGKSGDRLWVRETWMPDPPRDGAWPHVAFDGCKPQDMSLIPEQYRTPRHCLYRADGHENLTGWTPAIHMFRWVSRITLDIVGVRAERLLDISEADAQAEGCAVECMTPTGDDSGSAIHGPGGYRALWESINGPGSWDANPWVWVVEFTRAAAAMAGEKG